MHQPQQQPQLQLGGYIPGSANTTSNNNCYIPFRFSPIYQQGSTQPEDRGALPITSEQATSSSSSSPSSPLDNIIHNDDNDDDNVDINMNASSTQPNQLLFGDNSNNYINNNQNNNYSSGSSSGYPPITNYGNNSNQVKRAILYIDLDNFPLNRPQEYQNMLDEIKNKYGMEVFAKKIFGDLGQFCKLPAEYQFSHQLINCPKVSSRKNTTDIALTIEVIKDLERKKPFDVYIIASSDSDFVPVVKAIRDEGKECWLLPSHTYPHETLLSICSGVLGFNSLRVTNTVSNGFVTVTTTGDVRVELSKAITVPKIPTSPEKRTSPKTSPRNIYNSNTASSDPYGRHYNLTNRVPPPAKDEILSIDNVKVLITKIVRQLRFSGTKTFNMSFVHERLREKGILYHHYKYPTFKSLFEEWKKENPKFQFKVGEKGGELTFVEHQQPTESGGSTTATDLPVRILSRGTELNSNKNNTSSDASPVITNKTSNTGVSSTSTNYANTGGVKELKKRISMVIQSLQSKNTQSFNMSFIHERLRENGYLYSDYNYPSFKVLFEEWKSENPNIQFGTKKRSGELFFLKAQQ